MSADKKRVLIDQINARMASKKLKVSAKYGEDSLEAMNEMDDADVEKFINMPGSRGELLRAVTPGRGKGKGKGGPFSPKGGQGGKKKVPTMVSPHAPHPALPLPAAGPPVKLISAAPGVVRTTAEMVAMLGPIIHLDAAHWTNAHKQAIANAYSGLVKVAQVPGDLAANGAWGAFAQQVAVHSMVNPVFRTAIDPVVVMVDLTGDNSRAASLPIRFRQFIDTVFAVVPLPPYQDDSATTDVAAADTAGTPAPLLPRDRFGGHAVDGGPAAPPINWLSGVAPTNVNNSYTTFFVTAGNPTVQVNDAVALATAIRVRFPGVRVHWIPCSGALTEA